MDLKPDNKGQRKYNIALYIIASANVLGFAGILNGSQVVALLTGVGIGYGLFNRWKGRSNEKQASNRDSE